MNSQTLEKNRARASEWYYANREKALKRIRLHYHSQKNNPRIKERIKKYQALNADKIKIRFDGWYKENRQRLIRKARVWKQQNPERAQFLRYQERARSKNSEFALTYEQFLEAIRCPCVYCGFDKGIVGIDRIDSSVGYLIDNIVPCCKKCNYMKLDNSLEEWFECMRDIFNNLGYKIIQ